MGTQFSREYVVPHLHAQRKRAAPGVQGYQCLVGCKKYKTARTLAVHAQSHVVGYKPPGGVCAHKRPCMKPGCMAKRDPATFRLLSQLSQKGGRGVMLRAAPAVGYT